MVGGACGARTELAGKDLVDVTVVVEPLSPDAVTILPEPLVFFSVDRKGFNMLLTLVFGRAPD